MVGLTRRLVARHACAAMAMALLTTSFADAADIKVLATTAMKAALDALAPQFAGASAHTPRIDYGPSGALAQRVAAGEAGDLVILAGGIDDLIRQGRVVPASRTDIARARIGVAVRKGAAKPDISSPEAFRRALLAARASRMRIRRAAARAGSIWSACWSGWASPRRSTRRPGSPVADRTEW